MSNRFRIEVLADNSGHWAGNAMIYGTFSDAEYAAQDLARRWLLVMRAQVVEFDEDGKTVRETIVFK